MDGMGNWGISNLEKMGLGIRVLELDWRFRVWDMNWVRRI